MKRAMKIIELLLATTCLAAAAQEKPLPAVKDLQSLAIQNYRKSEQARERYICTERIANDQLDGKGKVKKTSTLEREIFFVNGFEISQAVSKDGRALSPSDQKKRDDAVKRAIGSASDHRKPKDDGLVISAGDVLRMAKLGRERRIPVAGRPTIVFDVVSDPRARADTLEQKLMRAMEGTISIDEATGNVQDINTHGVSDVKVGGGLVATVHKGFSVHMLAAPQPDGVWLLVLAEGHGDARVGLFLKEGVAFRQETLGCRLFDVDASAVIAQPKAK